MANNPEQPPPTPEQRRRLRLSGKAAAFGLVMAFLITGFLIPAAIKLPRWIDYEIVLIVWWAIWLAALGHLLYHGQRVADDHQLSQPRSWFNWGAKQGASSPPAKRTASSDPWGGWYWFGPGDGEGCAWVLAAIVVVVAMFFLLWFLIEVAIPLVLFLLYLVPRGMLSHVVNDRHHCKGRLGRSLGWALVWATLYTAPLAGVVWYVHVLLARDLPGPPGP